MVQVNEIIYYDNSLVFKLLSLLASICDSVCVVVEHGFIFTLVEQPSHDQESVYYTDAPLSK